ncbi:hypothetical protein M5K25_023665 [Dendrobium thyrsiflorum]|uniref:Uncharacterized protein n=1 Tax=Dendrobium thyrsiflorum TaxID=117978 RepID=A0ABD0UG16_DENTH
MTKKQELEKKRKKNTNDFVMEEKVEANSKKTELYKEEREQTKKYVKSCSTASLSLAKELFI